MTARAAIVAGLVATTAMIALGQLNLPEPPEPAPAGPTVLRPVPHTDRDGTRHTIATLEGRR